MKSQLGSAIVALSAFAAVNIVSTSAHAQQQQGQQGPIIGPQGGVVVQPQGVTLTPGAPAPGANGAAPTAQPAQTAPPVGPSRPPPTTLLLRWVSKGRRSIDPTCRFSQRVG